MKIINYKYRVRQIYCPPTTEENINQINELFDPDKTRFYAYGRSALYNGLLSIGLKEGDRLLIPSLICRDILSSLNKSGISPIYYDVDKDLKPILNLQNFEKIKAILVINYFGFSQDLKLIKQYCKTTGCILIEDNAHGFLSCDSQGKYLGTRGDIGIFSMRKTIPLLHGAALYMNDTNKLVIIPEQLEYYDYNSLYFNCKEILRKIFPLIGISGFKIFSNFIRMLRKIRIGNSIAMFDVKDEMELPLESNPVKNLIYKINTLDLNEEKNRRREIYQWLEHILAGFDIKPVFMDLPDNCVPYTFPFYCFNENINIIKKELYKFGLEIFNWPTLPKDIASSSPQFYSKIWCVRLVW